MAQERKKAAAKKPRVKNTAQAPEPQASASLANATDMPDDAIAARPQLPAEPTPAQEPPATGFATQIKRPDPFAEMTVALSNECDGPKMRLYRSHRFQQMAIHLDEKPEENTRQSLRDAGWTWRPAVDAWTMQLGERPGQTHRQAQALFTSLANEIRHANGLEPVALPAQSR